MFGFIKLKYSDESKNSIYLTAPCLLPAEGDVSCLQVDLDCYFPVTVNVNSNDKRSLNLQSCIPILVKKKLGGLNYVRDPHLLRSLLLQSSSNLSESSYKIIQSFTENPQLLAFAQHMCDNTRIMTNVSDTWLGIAESFEDFCASILCECLSEEKPDALMIYLSLLSGIISLVKSQR